MSPLAPDFKTRRHIHVRGIVQGVGFRPFVYKLAWSLGLSGSVYNSSSGVTIEVEGGAAAIAEFVDRLQHNPPALAEITGLTVSVMDAVGGSGFRILESRDEAGEF